MLRRYFERLGRRRLASAPVALRHAPGLRGQILRMVLSLSVLAGFLCLGGAAGYWWALRESAQGSSRQQQALQYVQNQQQKNELRIARLEQQLKVESATREALALELKNAQSQALGQRQALDFFDNLLVSNDRSRPVRLLACEWQADGRRYRVLLAQGQDRAADFIGRASVTVRYVRRGQSSIMTVGEDRPLPVNFRHYQRLEGELALPGEAVAQQLEVRVFAADGKQPVASCQKRIGGV